MKRVAKYSQEYCPHFFFLYNIRQMYLYKQIKCFYMSNMTKQYKHTIKYLVESKKKKKFFISEKCQRRLINFYVIFIGWCSYLVTSYNTERITQFPFHYYSGGQLFGSDVFLQNIIFTKQQSLYKITTLLIFCIAFGLV